MKKNRKQIIDLNSVISPDEMGYMTAEGLGTGDSEIVVFKNNKSGKVFINSDYFVEELSKAKHENMEEMVDDVPTVYLSLMKKIRNIRKCNKNIYDCISDERLKNSYQSSQRNDM